MLHENIHVPYKNGQTNPRISPRKIIVTTEIDSSGQVSNSDYLIDFHINYFIHPTINASINKNEFSSFLKLAYVIPVFKKGSKNSKQNYQPIRLKTKKKKIMKELCLKYMKELCLNK